MSGSVQGRQQSVGDFETEILGDNVEGVDDTKNRRPAQRSQTQLNGTCCRNVHNPGADTNEANSCYFDVNNAFQHLGGLTDAVAQAFINPPPPPRRTATNIINDFSRSSVELHIAETRNFTVGIAFWNNILTNLAAEHNALFSDQVEIGSSNDGTSTKTE